MSKYTFRGKHGDSHGINSEQGSLTTLMRLRDVENTVFEFTSDARLSKCKQQKRTTAKTLGVPCYGMCPLEISEFGVPAVNLKIACDWERIGIKIHPYMIC